MVWLIACRILYYNAIVKTQKSLMKKELMVLSF